MSYFPAVNSPQRLGASAPSKSNAAKVPLRPGHSLMDWVRLTKSGADLRGTGRRMLRIPLEELRKHDRRDDAWMAIRGFVYNVTSYMDYHPGGAAELMRGAGKDATQLFEDVHRWVNFESMLGACLIGKLDHTPESKRPSASFLAPPSSTLQIPALPSRPKSKSEASGNSNAPAIVVSPSASSPSVTASVKTSWYQSEEHMTLVCYTKCQALNARNSVVCDVEDDKKRLRAEIFAEEKCVVLDVVLEKPVGDEIDVRVNTKSGSVEIKLAKLQPGVRWIALGEYGEQHGTWVPRTMFKMRYRSCTLAEKITVTHDTYLYRFSLPSTSHMVVPIGCHVYFQADVEGMLIARPYTVVLPSLLENDAEERVNQQNFYVMIKVYDGGALTPRINSLTIGDAIAVSNYEGDFAFNAMPPDPRILMLAAGTGFTPMIRLIHHFLHQTKGTIQLLFFNKSKRDILWRDELKALQDAYHDRFSAEHVLSMPDEEWSGRTGRITLPMIKSALETGDSERPFVYVCGPSPFTDLTLKFLTDLGSSRFHAFTA